MSYRVYYPKHEENRMKNEGDVLTARKSFIKMFTEQNRTEQNRTEQNTRTMFYMNYLEVDLIG
ncbi:MAG: hypothetical protein MSH21_11350 [Clostridium sp.]|nr:hypothetical protein [Clostridium sp.]